MLGKINKMLRSHKGFTLIELMTVLIILGVILGIGVPKYLQVQATAAWEADETAIKNYAKAAETYAASINKYNTGVKISTLIAAKLITDDVLNRKAKTDGTSEKNEDKDKLSDLTDQTFTFNPTTGTVNNLGTVVKALIGKPPHGQTTEFPEYPYDTNPNPW